MIDPIGAFQEIRRNFRLYLQTAFSTQYESFERERESLLNQEGVFFQQPWIELQPRYASSGKRVGNLDSSDLVGFSKAEVEDFKEIVRCGLMEDFELRTHQLEMLRKVTAGSNAVVTAGTGSGKTESFLLPLFAYLAKESRNWTVPKAAPDHLNDWWCSNEWIDSCGAKRGLSKPYRVPQRGHETRPSAVRALILYPMNALVEDQLSRLRKALDSDASENWFAQKRSGNRFYFGRYNGDTPVAGSEFGLRGKPAKEKNEELLRAMQDMHEAQEAVRIGIEEKSADPNSRYFFPRLEGAEAMSGFLLGNERAPQLLVHS